MAFFHRDKKDQGAVLPVTDGIHTLNDNFLFRTPRPQMHTMALDYDYINIGGIQPVYVHITVLQVDVFFIKQNHLNTDNVIALVFVHILLVSVFDEVRLDISIRSKRLLS